MAGHMDKGDVRSHYLTSDVCQAIIIIIIMTTQVSASGSAQSLLAGA